MLTMTPEERKIYKKLIVVNRNSYQAEKERRKLKRLSKKQHSDIEFIKCTQKVAVYGEVYKQPAPEGYEDIHSNKPYLVHSRQDDTAFIEMLYVPPTRRKQGEGTKLVTRFIAKLQKNIKVVQLCAADFEDKPTKPFYKKLGFTEAYISAAHNSEASKVLVKAVNGYTLPPKIDVKDEYAHWLDPFLAYLNTP